MKGQFSLDLTIRMTLASSTLRLEIVKKIDLVAVGFTAEKPERFCKRCGLNYCKMKMQVVNEATEMPLLSKKEFMSLYGDGYCLLLPLLRRSDDGVIFEGQYTIVTHKWEVLGDNGLLSKPGLCQRLYGLEIIASNEHIHQ